MSCPELHDLTSVRCLGISYTLTKANKVYASSTHKARYAHVLTNKPCLQSVQSHCYYLIARDVSTADSLVSDFCSQGASGSIQLQKDYPSLRKIVHVPMHRFMDKHKRGSATMYSV